jgi:hypothetical protein
MFCRKCRRGKIIDNALTLYRERGDEYWVALTLKSLGDANRQLCLCKEGILQAREALEGFERFRSKMGQSQSLLNLWLLGIKKRDPAWRKNA